MAYDKVLANGLMYWYNTDVIEKLEDGNLERYKDVTPTFFDKDHK